MRSPSSLPVVAVLLCAACGDPVSPPDPTVAHSTALASYAAPARSEGAALSAAPIPHVLPLRGRFEGNQSVTPLDPPLASVAVSASGNATLLGRFTFQLPHTVNFATRSAQGTATLVAANGDVVIASFTGQAQIGAVVSIVESATITGGTGRFAGATGSFTIQRIYDPVAGVTTGSFAGSLSAPNAAP